MSLNSSSMRLIFLSGITFLAFSKTSSPPKSAGSFLRAVVTLLVPIASSRSLSAGKFFVSISCLMSSFLLSETSSRLTSSLKIAILPISSENSLPHALSAQAAVEMTSRSAVLDCEPISSIPVCKISSLLPLSAGSVR